MRKNCCERPKRFKPLWLLVFLVNTLTIGPFAQAGEDNERNNVTVDGDELYTTCSIFMAPSTSGMGWGAFAGRDFRKGEVVEMAPGIIPLDEDSSAYLYSALLDYSYAFYRMDWAGTTPSISYMQAVMLGFGMVYNHHPSSPNLEYTAFGREPAQDVPDTAQSIGFMAVRDISAGEELFSVYKKEDGGKDWFGRRKIPMNDPGSTMQIMPLPKLEKAKAHYCSKIFAGIGRNTWTHRILPILPPNVPFFVDTRYLPPYKDAEIGSAVAKVPIKTGERIEWGTGMMMSQQHHLQGTPLGPVAWTWHSLDSNHQEALKTLRLRGKLRIQVNEWKNDYEWERSDGFISWEDVAILPIGGSLGLLHRSSSWEDTNCDLRIPLNDSFEPDNDSIVVALEIIATKDIQAGEMLHLNLLPPKMPEEEAMLMRELKVMGRTPIIPLDPADEHEAVGEL